MNAASETDRFIGLAEAQLRQLSDAQAVLRNARAAQCGFVGFFNSKLMGA